MSPLVIRIMLACYYSLNPQEEIGEPWHSVAGKDARYWLEDQSLIDSDNRATERGKAWVDFICATPLPVQKWCIPDRSPD